METTGINKTVYRSDVISALDSFTSVRNVLAWEMFQDGQVRNYDGVVNDLQRLYPDIDFDSVTENVDPESIAADDSAIYALVDDILNKLIESGISKDNFNYAIWACDNPENVADTYGVDIDDVSAYKITDGILLQDLGYEGQLYGVAEYPEEEWDVIESALKGGNMKTREDYKKYYLEQLTEQFGDMTERDYNSAQKFCYDEEWNLGEVGNMAEAIDGLGDAWKEYQKQYKEGFEIMNGVTSSKKNITSGRWNVKTNEDQMDYIGNFFEGLPSYIDAESPYNEEKFVKAVNDYIFGWMYEDSDFSETDKKKITRNFLKLYKDYYNNGEPKDDLNTYYFEGEGPSDPRLIEWLHSVLSDKELNVPFTTWHYVESSKKNIKSSKAEELEMFENESVYGNESEFNDFKKNHPDFTITYLDWKKYLNGYEDDVQYEFEDENGNMYTWDMIKTEIDNWVGSGDFEEQNGELPEYFEKDGTPKYKKIYDDFWDISSNGAFSRINSSRRNNMKKTIKSSVRDHYLLGKQNFLTKHVFGIDDDGDTEYEYDFGEELLNAEMAIFENSDTGFVGFDIESHRAGKTKTRHEVLDYDGLENKIEGSDIKNGVAIYEDSNGIITVATMGSNWHNSKTGEEGTDYTLFKAVDYNAEPEDEDEEIESSHKPIKSSKWVEEVADKKGITFDQVLEIFKDNGYGEDEADDFWNSKWNDVSDAFGEDGIAGLDELFGIEIETEDNDIYEDDKDIDYDKYHLNHGEVKTEDFQKELMNTGYSKEDIDYVFGNNKLLNMQYLDKYWQDRVRRELEFRKGKSVTSARKSIKSGYTGTNVTVEYGPYGEEKDFPFYDMKGETVEQIDEKIGYYDEVKTAWGSDGESYMILQDRADSEDKIAVLEDDYNNWVENMSNEEYSKIIGSSKKGEKKMKIQSKRLIKSGTSNFGSNDNVYGYDFPLVTYIAENYVYDEENDVDTEERDYDLDSLEYRDEIDNATDLAAEMDIPLYDDYHDPDYAPPFCIKFRDGYYEGIWIEIKEGGNTEDLSDAEFDNLAAKINTYLDTLVKDYGWQKLGVTARFSNGETMYHKIDNSRKPIQSANYDGIKKQMQYTLDVLKEDAEDSDEEYAERMGYDGTDAGAVRYAINRFKNEYGIRNRYNVVNQSELADWLAGLPLSFDYANYNILQKGVEWGYLPPIQEGTDLTRKEANWLDNWWNGLANNILKLARKYNVGITSSRKSVTSGLTFRQAVQDFKAAGQWNDYYEMQQDWESYKDELERDGLISEKTRSTWGNPCTPETFKRWNK